jgi:hypothetical protein
MNKLHFRIRLFDETIYLVDSVFSTFRVLAFTKQRGRAFYDFTLMLEKRYLHSDQTIVLYQLKLEALPYVQEGVKWHGPSEP